MNNSSYADIIADEAYQKGYKAGQKSGKKKYETLFYLAKQFFNDYESSFGEPDREEPTNKEYFQLQRILSKPIN